MPLINMKNKDDERFRGVIADGVTVYEGNYAAAKGPHTAAVIADSTLAGFYANYLQTNGYIPLGFWGQPAGDKPNYDDDELGTVGDGEEDALIHFKPGIVEQYPVAGATAETAVFKPVYFSDLDSATMTPPTKEAFQHGFLLSRRGNGDGSGTSSVVYFYSASELLLQGILGGTKRTFLLANVDLKSIANGIVIDGIIMYNHAQIVDCYAVVNRADAGGTSVILSVTINTVDISTTGITIASATKGARLTIAALDGTGDEHYHDGDEINVVAKSTTGSFTDGNVNVYLVVRNLPGY